MFAEGDAVEPDLGPQTAQVKALLQALPRLAARCHDPEGQALWDGLVDQSFVAESDRADARSSAFSAAVLTSRRRVWALVRRSGTEGLGRSCPSCRTSRTLDREAERVLAAVPGRRLRAARRRRAARRHDRVLTAPVSALVAQQRRPTG